MDAIFRSFDERCLGAASIGQVHRATLTDGRQAVVKVCYTYRNTVMPYVVTIITTEFCGG